MVNASPETQLQEQFVGRPWFHSVGRDQFNRLVVYTNFMCHETLHDIPDRVDGIQVLVHFAASKLATREQFTNNDREDNLPIPLVTIPQPAIEIVDVTEFAEDDLSELTAELDALERLCGSNILQEIFYEIHDGVNAVTNLSPRFPDVHRRMKALYTDFGFDVIYEELDG
jgi:hypothetical protein